MSVSFVLSRWCGKVSFNPKSATSVQTSANGVQINVGCGIMCIVNDVLNPVASVLQNAVKWRHNFQDAVRVIDTKHAGRRMAA
ncbi:MAG: hypothetical protein KDB01_26735 [Planctomycetaceae bacterium]|nr:hypothetical protein [Planctomycetaceae bacterium]